MTLSRSIVTPVLLVALAGSASAQWNPSAGDWGKSDPRDIRVMTWNVQDMLCSGNAKIDESVSDWEASARVVAAMKPDVLILQEAGDNSGNGGGTLDDVSTLTTVANLFFDGGTDPFLGGAVTAYVQLYAPGYDLPHIFVSTANDGFNRNVILSRFPFVDLNGDGLSVRSDISGVRPGPGGYPVGGAGGIRGFMFAEINLPDADYSGDLVVGNAHLKSGGTASDATERQTAAKNVAFYIDQIFNGKGTPTPDPDAQVLDSPAVQQVLNALTPVIIGGDWNEDELLNATKGPAEWLTLAQNSPGTDGTDRDRGDMLYDDARDLFDANNTSNRRTQGSSKLDYLAWQDSIVTLRRAWVFKSLSLPVAARPDEIQGYRLGGQNITGDASDHFPVIADFILPGPPVTLPGAFALVTPSNNATGQRLNSTTVTWSASPNADTYELDLATDPGFSNIILNAPGLVATSYPIPAGLMTFCTDYYWRVEAINGSGSTPSTPASFAFTTWSPGDCNGDTSLDAFDFNCFVDEFNSSNTSAADVNEDGTLDAFDFNAFVDAFNQGCP